MMTNIGVIDGVARFLAGLALLGWCYGYFGAPLGGILGWPVWIVGVYALATGIFRFCPVYALAGIDSCAPYRMDADALRRVAASMDKDGHSH